MNFLYILRSPDMFVTDKRIVLIFLLSNFILFDAGNKALAGETVKLSGHVELEFQDEENFDLNDQSK